MSLPVTPASRSVLLVEDEPALQRIFGTVLSDIGHTVTCVDSAEEALIHLQSRADATDLILADKNLPGQTGVQLLQRVRAYDAAQGRTRAFVLVTGYPSRDSLMVALAEHAEGYLVKPFASLKRAVQQLDALLSSDLSARRQAHRRARRVADALSTGLPAAERCLIRVDETLLGAAVDDALQGQVAATPDAAEVVLADDVDTLVECARLYPQLGRCLLTRAPVFDDLMTLVNIGGALCDPTALLLRSDAA